MKRPREKGTQLWYFDLRFNIIVNADRDIREQNSMTEDEERILGAKDSKSEKTQFSLMRLSRVALK